MAYICACTKIAFQLRFFLEIAYKGTNFHGWQIQPNAITIQECITKAFETVCRVPVEIVGAGRTDAGVHAEQLFAHVDLPILFDKNEVLYKINSLLPNEIVLLSIFEVNKEAHARFDACSRSYEYRIFLGRSPFLIETTWQINHKKFNMDLMNQAASVLLKYTNFKCFSRSKTDVKTYDCKIKEAIWVKNGNLLVFKITADRFLRNMVRAIVGTLIEIGEGKLTLSDFENILKSENRCNAGASAPARGLFLTNVKYSKTIFKNE